MAPRPVPPTLAETRAELRRVATHVLARARAQATDRFGLRVTPGGVGTPAFGPDADVVRLAGGHLVREHRPGGEYRTDRLDVAGRSLDELAAFAGVDLDHDLSVGSDTPPLGDRSARVHLDPAALSVLWHWFALGNRALEALLVEAEQPSVIQLWPEHFDLAVDVATASGRVNLGASPGDADHPDPYLYVGPWGPDRPGDPSYWSAGFGAVCDYDAVRVAPDPLEAAIGFFRRGLALLDGR